jgi:hypothetical protein
VWIGGAFLKDTNAFLAPLATTHRSCGFTTKTLTTPTPATTTTSILQAIIEYDDFLPNPHPDFTATDVVTICMNTLIERKDGGGLEVCFDFSSDQCRAAVGGSSTILPNRHQPSKFWSMPRNQVSVGSLIPGTPTRGAMQTVLMDAILPVTSASLQQPGDDGARRFLWTLQQERRPPRQGYWVVHSVIYVKNAYQLTL